jgi:hypothetical protein
VNSRLIQLRERRARLLERAARQREELAGCVAALGTPIAIADRGIAIVRYIRARPGLVTAAAAIVMVLRPRRSFGWARRGFALWQSWRWLSTRLRKAANV